MRICVTHRHESLACVHVKVCVCTHDDGAPRVLATPTCTPTHLDVLAAADVPAGGGHVERQAVNMWSNGILERSQVTTAHHSCTATMCFTKHCAVVSIMLLLLAAQRRRSTS